MPLLDHALLMLAAVLGLLFIITHRKQFTSSTRYASINSYHLMAFGALSASTLLLGLFGWDILGFMGDGTENKLVAVVASAIPFAWATGMIAHRYPKYEKLYLGVMSLALLLITVTRFAEMKTLGRIIYPVAHSFAGITVIGVPIIAVLKQKMPTSFLLVSLSGFLISAGGMSMAFLIAGRQLLFMSQDVLFTLMAPLLLVTILLYAVGLTGGFKTAFFKTKS